MPAGNQNEIRLANTLWLFEAYKQEMAPGSPDLRGLHKAFAINLGISPSYWAQIRSPERKKGIGPNLARQFERKFGLKTGWLDEEHSEQAPSSPPPRYEVIAGTIEEQAFLDSALACYRTRPQATQQAIDELMPATAASAKKSSPKKR